MICEALSMPNILLVLCLYMCQAFQNEFEYLFFNIIQILILDKVYLLIVTLIKII